MTRVVVSAPGGEDAPVGVSLDMAVDREVDRDAIEHQEHVGRVVRGEPADHDVGREAGTLPLLVHLDARRPADEVVGVRRPARAGPPPCSPRPWTTGGAIASSRRPVTVTGVTTVIFVVSTRGGAGSCASTGLAATAHAHAHAPSAERSARFVKFAVMRSPSDIERRVPSPPTPPVPQEPEGVGGSNDCLPRREPERVVLWICESGADSERRRSKLSRGGREGRSRRGSGDPGAERRSPQRRSARRRETTAATPPRGDGRGGNGGDRGEGATAQALAVGRRVLDSGDPE